MSKASQTWRNISKGGAGAELLMAIASGAVSVF